MTTKVEIIDCLVAPLVNVFGPFPEGQVDYMVKNLQHVPQARLEKAAHYVIRTSERPPSVATVFQAIARQAPTTAFG